ncbi:MAG TPA: biotin/lipoyl-containing protein [Thermoanaerobaculia bacterium]|nr:biotin/lipoyl-containing protein [Thermoanaerobaculia bacterium]
MRRLDFVFRGDGEPEEIRLEGDAESWRLTRAGATREISAVRLPDGRLSLLLADGRQICGRVLAGGAGDVEVVTADGTRRVYLTDPLHDRLARGGGSAGESGEEEIRALMPGRVLEVRVRPGDRVAAGDVLVVLEAMKMQNEIRAGSGGVVARCAVSPGEAVEGRALLLVVRRGADGLDLSPPPG